MALWQRTMRNQVSYTPPGRTRSGGDEAVRRRHVLYVPGYDPDARSRSRSLFVRELIRYGRRFGLSERSVTPAEQLPGVPASRWRIRAARDGWTTDTVYDVLRWDDIVARDFARPMPACLARLALSFMQAIGTGLTMRLFRINWIFACVTIYPAVMVLALALAAVGLGYAAAHLIWSAAWPLAIVAGLGVAAGTVALARPFYARWYVWHLLHDWLFNWEHGSGRRPDYDARVERFAAHLREVAAGSDADEILIVGHSSGAGMAMEMLARALDAEPDLGRSGPAISLVTIGTSLPVAALNARADAIRGRLARVMRAEHVLWVEYQAPQDWLNAAGFNPVRMPTLGLAERDCVNPVIRSARFAEITSDQTYRLMLRSPFRMHFQFMMANDRPGEYDFYMIVLGPLTLARRIHDPAVAARLVAAVPAQL